MPNKNIERYLKRDHQNPETKDPKVTVLKSENDLKFASYHIQGHTTAHVTDQEFFWKKCSDIIIEKVPPSESNKQVEKKYISTSDFHFSLFLLLNIRIKNYFGFAESYPRLFVGFIKVTIDKVEWTDYDVISNYLSQQCFSLKFEIPIA